MKKNAPGNASRDVNVRIFQTASHLDLKYLKEQLGEKVDAEEGTRKKAMNIGDCCTLTFFGVREFPCTKTRAQTTSMIPLCLRIRIFSKQMSNFSI